VGTLACVSCHEEQHRDWLGSHHDLAMQKPTPQTVLGDFNGARIKYYGEIVRFVRDGDAFAIEALGADGKPGRFPVVYTFGVEPLQQYLVEVEQGRLQAFAFAWDTRPKARSGQRWFHLQPGEYIEPGDALHWTGPSYNWNQACADCHSTAVRKRYDRASQRYRTEYAEIDVGCEACHGPGSRHVQLLEARTEPLPADLGFDRRLPPFERREWSFVEGRDIAVPVASPSSDDPETCAPCHSRRADLGGDRGGYHDRYRLATLDELLYFDDGQIKDEVYEYGSFLQSKMHAAGVICGDCHDGHSGALRAEGNALCGRCHRADVFDGPQHHFHAAGTPGSLCTDCHMPQRTYMGIDQRADHRLGLPRPALSERVGAPDACTACHRDRRPEWAERRIAERFPTRTAHPFAEPLHAARRQRPGGEAALVELVAAGPAPDIVRGTALLELRNLASPALPALLTRASGDASPVVRRSVAAAARELAPEQRDSIVRPMLRDPARTVRIEAVAALLGSDASHWPESDRAALKAATAEYIEARSFSADRGEGLVDLARVATLAGDYERAEDDLREAIEIDPTFTAAYVNLADLHRVRQRDQEGETVLRQGLKAATDRAAIEFALGLTLVRLGRRTEAMTHLRRAHELRPEVIRFGSVYAIGQYDLGRHEAALRTLREIHDRYPANREVLRLLVGYSRQSGRAEAAERYEQELERMEGR
jgi:tetratricopeptide (TPR) repeat protein